jgi:hypothetical protein
MIAAIDPAPRELVSSIWVAMRPPGALLSLTRVWARARSLSARAECRALSRLRSRPATLW